jgi:hypothetical protein
VQGAAGAAADSTQDATAGLNGDPVEPDPSEMEAEGKLPKWLVL